MQSERITLVHIVFGATRGGVERDVLVIVTDAPEITHVVTVLGETGPMVNDWRDAGATVDILGADSGKALSIAKNLQEVILKYRPDGVIAWFGLVQLPQIIYVCNRNNVKLVAHAGNPAHTMSVWTNLRFLAMAKWWPASGPLPIYACCSDYVSQSFASSLYLRQFPRTTIYNGIELPSAPMHQPKAYDPSKPFVIGMTARLSKIKSHETLIRAFAIIAKSYPNARLELAGDGETRESLQQLTRELGIASRVTFLGDVADVYSVMTHWDLFAYATTEREGLGNALSEAMALGLPCVITDVGPMREFGEKDGAVCLVRKHHASDLAAAICRLIEDADGRANLCRTGREFSRIRFSPSTFASGYLRLFGIRRPPFRPRIMHHVFGAARGGVEGNARAMIRALPDFEHVVTVFGESGPMVEDWERAGATVEILGPDSAKMFAISRSLRNAIQKYRPDGVIAWFGLVQLPQIIQVCNQQNVKLAVHAGNPAHTMSLWTNLRYWGMSKWWPASGPLPVYACCSDYVAKSFEFSPYLKQFPRTTIYNGIEIPSGATHRPKEYDSNSPFVVGMTARLSEIKDHATLLRAMALVIDRYSNVRLELAGDGNLRGSLQKLAEDLGIADHVDFLGDVSDVYSVMRRWDLFAYATTEREGLGNAVSEAMALGLPCILTDVGPMREFDADGNTVKLVPVMQPNAMASEIISLMLNLDERSKLSSSGFSFARRQFDFKVFSKRYAQVIDCEEV
jgi:glycosyltransferase involved in cell wall biosynthesis